MKFGINRVDITPDYRTLMDGYEERNDINDGVNDPLTFTSLIIEEKDKKLFIGAADIVSLGCERSKSLRQKIAKALKIDFSSVMINCSHTHGGVKIRVLLFEDENSDLANIAKQNIRFMEDKILASVKKASKEMQEGFLSYGEGKTSIPMNRRLTTKEGIVRNLPNPAGETDNKLQVIKIVNARNEIAAILARVSCHAVATGAQHFFTADFPGTFRAVLEKYFPGTLTVFLQGIGGDARPAFAASADKKSWRPIPYSELSVIGDQLFWETLQVLLKEMTPLRNLKLKSEIKDVFIPVVDKNADVEELAKKFKNRWKSHIEKIRNMIKNGEKLPDGKTISVQMFHFNKDFSIVGIDAELLCGIGKKIEKKISSRFKMVCGYTNGSQFYFPDKKEYKRGGYEVESHVIFKQVSPLSPKMEDITLDAVANLDKKLN